MEALRGQGIGGWLTGLLAADLAARGRRVALSCKKERLNFYHRLGFAAEDTVQRYALDRAAGGKIKGLRSREEKQGGVPPTLR